MRYDKSHTSRYSCQTKENNTSECGHNQNDWPNQSTNQVSNKVTNTEVSEMKVSRSIQGENQDQTTESDMQNY